MNGSRASRTWRLGCATTLAVGALAAPAAADRVYHSEHLQLTPVNGAPLRSGFVENIKAQGPQIYAHEIYVLNGAAPNAGYSVTRDLFAFDPTCTGDVVFHSQVAAVTTNRSGNARADAVIVPAEVAGFAGVHGVTWTVRNDARAITYRTTCTAVTLD
jgi:hypothetical protein